MPDDDSNLSRNIFIIISTKILVFLQLRQFKINWPNMWYLYLYLFICLFANGLKSNWLWYQRAFMLLRDNKFDEISQPDKMSKIYMTHALARLSASVSRRINAHLSTYGERSHMSVHSKTTYELPLYTLNFIDVCTIERRIQVSGAQRKHKGS
jgi:hypothetical protein